MLASDTFGGDESGAPGRKKLPSVQVGDPFMEKVLIECCLELYAQDLVVGIQDLGGAGLSCATSELASAGDGGMRIELETVPLRAANMTPAEILSSESQERMCAVVTPDNVDAFMAVCRKWDVLATVIGEVTDGDRLEITWHGETVVDVPPRTVAHEGPIYERPVERPDSQDALNADTSAKLPRPSTGEELRATLFAMVGSPHLCSRAFITEQYDRYVRGNTVLAENADGGVLRIDETTGRGIAISTDASGRYTALDPYTGAQLALAEAYRNVAVTGATPVAVTNCLNFGSPEDPGVMWQFSQAVRGLADGCAALGIPVTGGNVSFYNQTGTTPILPTPVVGVLGVIDDVKRRIPTGLGTEPGETLILLGDTRDEFDGSIWAQVTGDHLGGLPPTVDLDREKLLADVLSAASRDGLVSAAHDLSEGGLIQAVVEAALTGETGCRIVIPEALNRTDPFVTFCSRSRRAGFWWRCRGPRRAGSWACAKRADYPLPASASSTRDRNPEKPQSRCRACSRQVWRTCEARRRACFPGCSGDCADPRTTPLLCLGMEPGPARLRRDRIRRAVLLPLADAVAAAAGLAVSRAHRRVECGHRLRHRRIRLEVVPALRDYAGARGGRRRSGCST